MGRSTRTGAHTCIHMCAHTCTHMHAHMHTNTRAYAHAHAHVAHTCMHTVTHTYTHTEETAVFPLVSVTSSEEGTVGSLATPPQSGRPGRAGSLSAFMPLHCTCIQVAAGQAACPIG